MATLRRARAPPAGAERVAADGADRGDAGVQHRTIKRGNSYSIFLDGSLLPKLREFLATEKPKGAVEIEGKKMSASYRFTFAGERAWRKAFAEAAEQAEKQETGDKGGG